MKYFLVFLYITLISNLSFADEIMSCKINDEQSFSYKLQDNLFSKDKIFHKFRTKWIQNCPCQKVQNKSVTCLTNQNVRECDGATNLNNSNVIEGYKYAKEEDNPFLLPEESVTNEEDRITIDFETRELRLFFFKTDRLVTLQCKLVE